MYIFILFLIVLITIFKFRSKFRSIKILYYTYKGIIDPENKHGHFFAIKNVFKIVYSLYNSFKPKQINPPEKFNKKYLKISYKYNDKNYFYLLKVPRGITPILSITDENDHDIEDIIYPYLGPNLDCHGANIYPKDFGYSQIKIKTIFDKTVVFDEDQKIEIT